MTDSQQQSQDNTSALLADEIKRQTGQLEAIRGVITAAAHTSELGPTLYAALDAVLGVVPLEASGITLIDTDTNELVMVAQRGLNYDFTSTPMRIPLGTGISGAVLRTGEPVITGDPARDSRLAVPEFAQEQVKAQVLLPMRARGQVIGILSAMSHSPYTFTEGQIKTLRVIADQVGLAIDNARLVESVLAQRSRLEAVIHATADAIIATDERGRINVVNRAAELFFRISADEIMGKPLCESPFYPPLQERLQTTICRDRERGSGMIELSLPDGRFLCGFASPVYSPQVQEIDTDDDAWVVVFQDVTHLKQAERARALFIQTAAHEIRNPLAVTLSALQMLQRQLREPTPTQKEVMDIGLRGVGRMQELIDDMLDLERIESGMGLAQEPFDLSGMIERCVSESAPLMERKSQKIAAEIDPTLSLLVGDERWLFRAVMNLISNAHKYTPEQSTIRVRVGMRAVSNRPAELVIEVQDDGPGIPRESLSRLFERFFRPRSSDDRDRGSGLGLSIVKTVAERHGGYVYVHSETAESRNHGTVFGIVLPYQVTIPAPELDRV